MRKIVFVRNIFLLVGISWSLFSVDDVFASNNTVETDRVIVQIKDEDGNESIESISKKEMEQFNEGHQLEESSILHNAKNINVLEPDYIRQITLQEDTKSKSWGVKRIGAQNLNYNVSKMDGSVIVAVIDTGVDYTHAFLKDRMVQGYDFVANDTDPMDVHFHGTHIAGIIADTTPSNVKIMPIRVLNEEGSGYDSDVAQGIHFAVDNGANIINMSFIGEGFSQYLSDAIEYALSKNVLVVVSSGNDGSNTANYYPASDKKVIVVSATDQNDNVASFSNTGDSIDISAPGVGIVSSIPGESFASYSGTSMAAPFVSGVAAMLKLEAPVRSVKGLERLLKQYVDDRGPTGWDSLYGEGILNISSIEMSPIVKVQQPIQTEENKIVSEPTKYTDFISLPDQKNVPVNKEWSIQFNRMLTERDIISIKVLNGETEIPIKSNVTTGEKLIIASPISGYQNSTSYKLIIMVEKGKSYQMNFETTR